MQHSVYIITKRKIKKTIHHYTGIFMHYQDKEKYRDRGITSLGTLIFILIIAILVFLGSQIIPFYYSYYEIQGLMQAQADKASELSDKEILQNIRQAIKRLNIPADPEEDLRLNRFNGKVVIDLSYQEVLYVDFGNDFDYDLWTFHFNPRGER